MFDFLKKTESAVKRSKETWFSKIAHVFDRDSIGKETWEELEELLILADVGVETTEKLLGKVKQRVKAEKLTQPSQVKTALKEEMVNLLNATQFKSPTSSPFVILVVGVNGSGKTTSIAKLAYSYTSQGNRVILAAADTFRAAAIEQLQYWGGKVGAQVISHKHGGDPGAVVFDAIQAAYSRESPVVIVDTAGRLHTKFNLMEELKKIKRIAGKQDVSAPHEVLLVMDATTGQNGLTQAKYFTQAVGVTDIFLTKLDSTAKGGIIFAIHDQLNIPIAYIGTGEGLPDIIPFNAETFVNAILP
ncbi:MAG: signal recognition particle-docking protein FtsY [Chloroflexota bacterium]|nr:signal recognition particle-docking protein FtsY [Chloroflexota bacterium]